MQASTDGPDARRQQIFDRRLTILLFESDSPFPERMLFADGRQRAADRDEVGIREQASLVEHFRMRDRGADVVCDQPVVQLEIVAGRVAQHPLIERSSLVPEPSHAAPSCSLGLNALRSATTKVPVPSLVKISASRLSVDLYVITCTRRTPPRMAFSMAVALGSMPSFKRPSSRSRFKPLMSVYEITVLGS